MYRTKGLRHLEEIVNICYNFYSVVDVVVETKLKHLNQSQRLPWLKVARLSCFM